MPETPVPSGDAPTAPAGAGASWAALAWPVLFAAFLVPAVLMAACGGGGSGGPGGSFGLTSRVPLTPLAFPDSGPTPGEVLLQPVFTGIDFDDPVHLTTARDGSSRLYVSEQDGRILVFEKDDPAGTVQTFLDLRASVGGPVVRGYEQGLLGLAFDPEFGAPDGSADGRVGAFYVHYSAGSPRRGAIARFEATFPGGGAPPTASAATQAMVLTVAQPYANHNGGMLEFGPDDMLYVGLGDGGSANDPHGNAQDPGTLLGSILRIDPRGSATYTVPTDNPFFGTAGVAPETWAYGVRNAWRFSFDRANGDFWLGDVGQWSREEVDRVAPGENLGWPVYEGHRSNANPGGLPPSAFTAPVVDYARAEGSCVIGGYVYRGTDVPELTGSYVYGDNGSGRIWALVHDGTSLTVPPVWIATLPGLTSFGEDDDAELYAVSHSGTIVKITPDPGDPPPPFPQKLSDTGLFTDTAALVPTAGLIEYDVAAPLWSDDALKRRWVGVPGTARITFQPVGAWLFPLGTVFVKHFELPLVAGDPSSAKRLETRVFLRETEGWAGYTYRWNEAGTDADLLMDGETAMYDIVDAAAPGGMRTLRWDYPSRTDCLRCHTDAAGSVLGVRTAQINRPFDYPSMTDNQLRSWNHIGMFHTNLSDPALYAAHPDPADDSLPVAGRARAYLDANCANCHRPGGGATTSLDLRHTTPTGNMNAIDVVPVEGGLGLTDPRIVKPGDPVNSVLLERMRRTDEPRMPPLASHVPDALGIELIEAWIDGL